MHFGTRKAKAATPKKSTRQEALQQIAYACLDAIKGKDYPPTMARWSRALYAPGLALGVDMTGPQPIRALHQKLDSLKNDQLGKLVHHGFEEAQAHLTKLHGAKSSKPRKPRKKGASTAPPKTPKPRKARKKRPQEAPPAAKKPRKKAKKTKKTAKKAA